MDAYLELHTSNEPELLRKTPRETLKDVPQSHMISGIHWGRFLSVIFKMISLKRILELGTSQDILFCLAEGLHREA